MSQVNGRLNENIYTLFSEKENYFKKLKELPKKYAIY
uniref:Uncharacterized protein n=1 Tax=Methanococcus voltae (strain ATCC BAA-1334 / A3) TaxID=456320 RepID=D7DSU7_METV3